VARGDAPLFLFESATHVMWAEEAAQESGVPVDVVPAPAGTRDVCGLALRTFPQNAETLERILREEGIRFRRHA
jgi:hypothetical protein